MKNLYKLKFNKFANNAFKKLVLLLLVPHAVACHAITATNYHVMLCSVVINAIFNTCFSSIIFYIGKLYFEDIFKLPFSIIWGELYENYQHRTEFSSELQIMKVSEITR
jgi:hypothetical protein